MKKLFKTFQSYPFHNGLEVRNIVAFNGRGGMPLLQGDLFLNGKK